MRFLKLLQLLNRFQKPRDRRRRESPAAQPRLAGCERVLEQRVLLSAVHADVVSQPVGDSEGRAGNQTEPVSLTLNDVAVDFLATQFNQSKPVPKVDPDGAEPVDDVVVSSHASSGAFDLAGLPSAMENLVAARDVTTVDPVDPESRIATSGVPAGVGAAELGAVDIQLAKDKLSTSVDSLDQLTNLTQKRDDRVPSESELSVDKLSAALDVERLEVEPLVGHLSADELRFVDQLHAEQDLPFLGGVSLRDTSINLNSFGRGQSEVGLSESGVAGIFPASRYHIAFAKPVVPIAGQSVDLLKASGTVWSHLSSHLLFGRLSSDFVSHVSAVRVLPACSAETGGAIGTPELIQLAGRSVVASDFAEAVQPAGQDSLQQTARQAVARIEVEVVTAFLDAVQNDDPPERFDILGIWQRLRFDCNPRGPPVDEPNLISEFTRQFGGDKQLQQLRFSIAPRGPSVAFCFQIRNLSDPS